MLASSPLPVRRLLRAAQLPVKEGRLRLREISAARRLLPDFLIIGAQKAGTSSLFTYLVEHPDILPPFRKEVHFFDAQYERGERRYRAFFPLAQEKSSRAAAGTTVLTGEATPYYLFHPHAPHRARAMVPNARLIVLLRDPVTRAFSQYQHSVRKGLEHRTFEDAIRAEREELPRELERMERDPAYRSEMHQGRAYLARGVYVDQLQRWAAEYSRDAMLLLRSEDFFADPAATFTRTLRFLGLDPSFVPARMEAVNRHAYASSLSGGAREYLEEYFRPHNRRLSEWTGGERWWS